MHQHKKRRLNATLLLLAIPTLVFSSVFSLFIQSTPAQAANYAELTVSQKARSYAYYRAANKCISEDIKTEIRADAQFDGERTNPANGYWFGTGDADNPDRDGGFFSGDAQNTATVSPFSGNSTGERGCSAIINTGLDSYWNEVSPADLLRALNYEWNGNDRWNFQGGNRSDLFKAFLASEGVSTDYTAPTEYFLNYNAFVNKCSPQELGPYESLSQSQKNRVEQHGTPGSAFEGTTVYTRINIGTVDGVQTLVYTYEYAPDGGNIDRAYLLYEGNFKTCQEMVQNITNRAGAYSTALRTDVCNPNGEVIFRGVDLNACIEGVANRDNPNFCNRYTSTSAAAACREGQGAEIRDAGASIRDNSQPDPSSETSTCNVQGVGWIVCPALTFMGGLADGAFGIIEQFLVINPALISSEDTYTAWQYMRNLANVAFIIAFIVIILSQLTSVGVSNYGVKKTLPRLVVAAILVNVSFFICQLAVDLSNITGASIYELLKSITPDGVGEDGSGNAGGWIVVITAAIATGAAAVLAISVPVLLAALLAVAVILLILMIRFALVVILTVIAPLAFVAYLLPNTEHLFKKWLKLFTSMLVLYPIVGFVFGASYLASRIVANAGGEIDNGLLQVTALGIAAVPLLVIPSILRSSLNAAGSIGGKLSALSAKSSGRIGKQIGATSRLGQLSKYRRAESEKRRALIQSGAYQGKGGKLNPRNIISNTNRAINESKYSGQFGDKMAASGVALADEQDAKDVKAYEILLQSQITRDPKNFSADKALVAAVQAGDKAKARAAQNVLFSQGGGGVNKFYSTMSSLESTADKAVVDSLRENITVKHGQFVKSKAADIVRWAAGVPGHETLAASSSAAGSWQMSLSDLSAQTAASLERALAANQIQARQAYEILRDPILNKNLDQDQVSVFTRAASGYSPDTEPPQGPGTGPGGLIVPGDGEFKIR